MNLPLEIVGTNAVEAAITLPTGMILDRAGTRKLLRKLEGFPSAVSGYAVFLEQLRVVLKRKDWLKISFTGDPESARKHGPTIGVVEFKPNAVRERLSPLQKWQRKSGVRR